MKAVQTLETKLAELLDKKSPVKLPESARKGLAHAFWWIALVFGILQLWAAWGLWYLGHYLEPLNETADAINRYYGYNAIDTNLNFFYYLAMIVVLIDAVILLAATPGLKAMKKTGWNLLFYSLLLNVAYGIVRLFSDVGGGFGALLWAVVVTVVSAFFVFQVRGYFTAAGVKPVSSTPSKPETPAKLEKSKKE